VITPANGGEQNANCRNRGFKSRSTKNIYGFQGRPRSHCGADIRCVISIIMILKSDKLKSEVIWKIHLRLK
jgi:hypothetical protein